MKGEAQKETILSQASDKPVTSNGRHPNEEASQD